jgi:hypothetical protein
MQPQSRLESKRLQGENKANRGTGIHIFIGGWRAVKSLKTLRGGADGEELEP